MTNGDKIRAANDMELARVITGLVTTVAKDPKEYLKGEIDIYILTSE